MDNLYEVTGWTWRKLQLTVFLKNHVVYIHDPYQKLRNSLINGTQYLYDVKSKNIKQRSLING